MSGLTNLQEMLASMAPELSAAEFVLVSIPAARYGDLAHLEPHGCLQEKEGLTLLLDLEKAASAGLPVTPRMRMITLGVHSSLEAVGLTAAIAQSLARAGIPANIWAGHFHDHILVPSELADEAMDCLGGLGS